MNSPIRVDVRCLVVAIVLLFTVARLPREAVGADEVPQHSPKPAALPNAASVSKRTATLAADSRPLTPAERKRIAHQWKLLQWCESRGHHDEMLRCAAAILEINPNQTEARALLASQASQTDGPDSTSTSRPSADANDVRELKQQVERAFRDLTSRSAATRDIALRTLVRLADAYRIPDLHTHAEELHARVQSLLSPNRNVIAEYRGTQSSLVSLPTRTTGVGIGSPVSLQLPELKTVQIGTSVGVPGS